MKRKLLVAMGLATALFSGMATAATVELDSDLKDYQKVSGISGSLTSVGSDSLANLMTLWAEEFKRIYPNVNIQIQAAGSSTAPPALTQGTSDIGPMSRVMRSSEIASFEKEHGYKPTKVGVAIDALAVYVHKDSPIKGLSISQVDAIFSSTRKCGGKEDVNSWGQVGVAGALGDRTIQVFGRNSVSGTYGFFKKKALCGGDFKSSVNEQPGSASVVQSVSASLNGIGYSGIAYKTAGVRTLPLSKREGGEFIYPTNVNALSGAYPLARVLYVYVNKAPNKPLEPVVLEFLKLVLSKQGQASVAKDGYIPLPASAAQRYLDAIM